MLFESSAPRGVNSFDCLIDDRGVPGVKSDCWNPEIEIFHDSVVFFISVIFFFASELEDGSSSIRGVYE